MQVAAVPRYGAALIAPCLIQGAQFAQRFQRFPAVTHLYQALKKAHGQCKLARLSQRDSLSQPGAQIVRVAGPKLV